MINSTPKLLFWHRVHELFSLIGNDIYVIIGIISLPSWLSVICIALLAGLSPAWSEFVFVVPEISCVNATNTEEPICWSTHDGCRTVTPKCAKIPQSCKKGNFTAASEVFKPFACQEDLSSAFPAFTHKVSFTFQLMQFIVSLSPETIAAFKNAILKIQRKLKEEQ